MIKKVFGVWDAKAQCYEVDPFCALNRGVALRMFEQGARDERSMLARFPDDMVLHELGEFDTERGSFVSYDKPLILVAAREYVVPVVPIRRDDRDVDPLPRLDGSRNVG